jgi:hypothetical protein
MSTDKGIDQLSHLSMVAAKKVCKGVGAEAVLKPTTCMKARAADAAPIAMQKLQLTHLYATAPMHTRIITAS